MFFLFVHSIFGIYTYWNKSYVNSEVKKHSEFIYIFILWHIFLSLLAQIIWSTWRQIEGMNHRGVSLLFLYVTYSGIVTIHIIAGQWNIQLHARWFNDRRYIYFGLPLLCMCLGWPTSPSRKPLTSFKNRGGFTLYHLLLLLCFFFSFLLSFFCFLLFMIKKILHSAMLKLSLKDKTRIWFMVRGFCSCTNYFLIFAGAGCSYFSYICYWLSKFF